MKNKKLEKEFYEATRSETLPFVINDSVEVVNGIHKGKGAAVISIYSLEPELTYLIEFGDGSGDIEVSPNSLKLL
jgi:hypothetical protein